MKKLIVFILVLLLTATPALACKPTPEPEPEPSPAPAPAPTPAPYQGGTINDMPSTNDGQEAIIPRCIEPFTGTPQPCYPPRSKGTLIEMLRPKSIHSKGTIWMIIQPD